MIKPKASIVFTLFLYSCIEPYDFRITDEDSGVAIESYISNKSFTETIAYPSEGRYFVVIIRRTSDVINIRDEYVNDAYVTLYDNNGNSWDYNLSDKAGYYFLYYDDFSADYNKEYQMVIELASGNSIISDWEKLPAPSTDMGDLHFEEKVVQQYVQINDTEKYIDDFDGIELIIDVDEKHDKQPIINGPLILYGLILLLTHLRG